MLFLPPSMVLGVIMCVVDYFGVAGGGPELILCRNGD